MVVPARMLFHLEKKKVVNEVISPRLWLNLQPEMRLTTPSVADAVIIMSSLSSLISHLPRTHYFVSLILPFTYEQCNVIQHFPRERRQTYKDGLRRQ